MNYRIKIEEEDQSRRTVYEQLVADLDVRAVINLINKGSSLEGVVSGYPLESKTN